MPALSLEKVRELLGTAEIPGNEKEQMVLRIRLGELLELNGERWIRENCSMLLEQWRWVVDLKTVR
ncbi:MAG: hypothetical protein ACM3KE_03485 [Hyphomicrobiales bacterium]